MRVFADDKQQQQFEKDGYVIVKAFDEAAIKEMTDLFAKTTGEDFSGFHNTLEIQSPEIKKEIYDKLNGMFEKYLQKYLVNYRAIGCGFVTKKSDPNSRVYPHQDWSFVDETQYSSLNLWAPLVDTTEENGLLKIFKGTHHITPSMRGSNLPPIFIIQQPDVLKYLTPLHMKAGEVVMYDHRLLHGSEPNASGKTRVAASFNVIPQAAQAIHYFAPNKQNLNEVYELAIDESFYNNYYLNKAWIGDPKANYIVHAEGYTSKQVPFTPARISEQQIIDLYTPKKGFLASLVDRLFKQA